MATSIPDFTKGLVRKPPVDFSKGLVAKPKGKPSSAGEKQESKPQKAPTHPFGTVTGFEESSGLPIVRRDNPEKSPIGDKDPATWRDVLHAPNSPDAIQEKATSEHPDIKQELKQIVAGVKGATLDAARDEKDEDRLEEKVSEDGQPPKTIPDFSAFRIAVDTPAARDEVVKAIREHFTIVREKDEFEKGAEDTGFHAHMLQVQQPGSDVSHEIQVLPKHVADIAEDTHGLYEKARTGDGAAAADLKSKNEAAYSEFKDGQHKYKFGNTQANLPQDSDAHKAISDFQNRIPKDHLANDGTDEEADKPHVTVRYGIQGDSKDKLREFIKGQKPFIAKLGKTAAFPPTEHSDGAAPLHAPVDSPELHKLNAEIQKHGDFAPSNFPEYKPHVTIAYVKPDKVAQHVGKPDTEGKTFNVNHISISDRDGNKEDVPMLGGKSNLEEKVSGKNPEPKDRGEAEPTSASEPLKKGDTVTLKDGRKATIAYAPPKGAGIAVYRLKTEDGKTIALRAKEVENAAKPAPDDKKGVILVDFDKTLVSAGGKPEAAMVDRIKNDLDAGKTVKIFTAKVANDNSGENRRFVQRWTKLHFGRELPVTNKKMHDTAEILDDKAFHVAPNTGRVEA